MNISNELKNVVRYVVEILHPMNQLQKDKLLEIIRKVTIEKVTDYQTEKIQRIMAIMIATKITDLVGETHKNEKKSKYKKFLIDKIPKIQTYEQPTPIEQPDAKTDLVQQPTPIEPKSPKYIDIKSVIGKYLLDKPPMDQKYNIFNIFQEKKIQEMVEHAIITTYISKGSPYNIIPSQIIKTYICLDSRNRRLDTTDWNKFSWYYFDSKLNSQGVVYSTVPLQNIIAMQLYQPVIPSPNESLATTTRISVLIEELKYFAFMATIERSYHWLCRFNPSTPTPTQHLELNIDDFNNGLFTFPHPIRTINEFTITLGDPINLFTFNIDRDNAIVSGYGATTTITTTNNHQLVNGNIVYINGFDTASSNYDNDLINTVNGLAITVTGLNTFTIPVNTSSGLVTWIPNQPITVFYGCRRLSLCLEFTLWMP